VSPTTADTTQAIVCSVATPASDADQDPLTYEYSWSDGASGSYSGATLPASETNGGEHWTCSVTASDDESLSGPPGQATAQISAEVSFTATGSDQTWVVPAALTSITVKLWAAGGGGSNGEGWQFPGAPGGYTEGVVSTTPGETLLLRVGVGGQRGSLVITNAYPAGGTAGYRAGYSAGGGGGRSALERSDGTELLVAGAGGGAGCTGWSSSSTTTGGGGGGLVGEDGSMGSHSCCSNCFGYGGSQSAGGAAPSGSCAGYSGTAGGKNFGGNGLAFPSPGDCGGGGGDGYYGGSSASLHAGGGGGSGYAASEVGSPLLVQATATTDAANNGDPDYPGGIGATGPDANGGDGYILIKY
jgi:hypothetical protein